MATMIKKTGSLGTALTVQSGKGAGMKCWHIISSLCSRLLIWLLTPCGSPISKSNHGFQSLYSLAARLVRPTMNGRRRRAYVHVCDAADKQYGPFPVRFLATFWPHLTESPVEEAALL